MKWSNFLKKTAVHYAPFAMTFIMTKSQLTLDFSCAQKMTLKFFQKQTLYVVLARDLT